MLVQSICGKSCDQTCWGPLQRDWTSPVTIMGVAWGEAGGVGLVRHEHQQLDLDAALCLACITCTWGVLAATDTQS